MAALIVALLIAVGSVVYLLFRTESASQVRAENINLIIETCYRRDNCGASKLISLSMIEARNDERLVEGRLIGGDIADPDNDNFPVAWGKEYTLFALCSQRRPRLAFQSNGVFTAEEFDLTNVPGMQVDNSRLYLGLCHGTQFEQVAQSPQRYGYSNFPNGPKGQFNIAKPLDLFD